MDCQRNIGDIFNVDWINQWYLSKNEASRHSICFKLQDNINFLREQLKNKDEINNSLEQQLATRDYIVVQCKYENKGAISEIPLEKTPISVTLVTQGDNLPSNDTPNKWPEGTICIAGDSILNGVDGSLLSQKRLMKVRQFPAATITDMYDHLTPILKRHPEFLILHIGTNDTSKYTLSEIVNKVFYKKDSL